MPESWTVRGQKGEPSTPVVDIMEGSISRGEPSTLYARIVDGSRSKGRTIHAGSRYYGRFMSQKRTCHAVCPNRGRFEVKRVNLPRWMLISWTVHILSTNLPTKHLEQTKSAKAPSGAARRNAKRWPEAMVRPERAPPSWGQRGNQNSHQAPRKEQGMGNKKAGP